MINAIFGVVRFLLGLVGAFWVLGGLYGTVYAASDRAWGPAISAFLAALFGFCLAYSAFVRAPWEPHTKLNDRAR